MLPQLSDDSDAAPTEWEVELRHAEKGLEGDRSCVLPAWSVALAFASLGSSFCKAGARKGWRAASGVVMWAVGSGCSMWINKSTARVGRVLVNSISWWRTAESILSVLATASACKPPKNGSVSAYTVRLTSYSLSAWINAQKSLQDAPLKAHHAW